MGTKGKIKVAILGRDNIGWSIDSDRKNTVALFSNRQDFEVGTGVFSADMVYVVWYDIILRPHFFYFLKLLKKFRKLKIFAVITNDIRNTPEKIATLHRIADVVVSPNSGIYNFIKDSGLKTLQMPFLVDRAVFRKLPDTKEEIAKKLGIDYAKIKDKILIGSFQRDSLGTDLSKPKWQKNPDLLTEIMQKLAKERFVLVLAGPRRHYIVKRCQEAGIPHIFIGNASFLSSGKDDIRENNLELEKINQLYNLIDIYLVTSQSEGGPKAVLESALTQTLIFSTDVGLAKDILDGDLIYSGSGAAVEKIEKYLFDKNLSVSVLAENEKKVRKALDEKKILEKIKDAYEN